MSVREQLIKLFENNRGTFLSGTDIAKDLGCSRAAVSKAVKGLTDSGYKITAVTNKGYRLESENDVLSAAGIEKYLSTEASGSVKLCVYSVTDSTNTRVREMALEGAGEGTVAVAGMQTAGKGRLGRKFYSPSDTGLYLSILLRPEMTAADALRITTAAAVAVADAAAEVSGRRADIKWVNDVYMDGRKICGILTEAAFSLENGGLDYAVCGIGINAYEPAGGFPEEIRDIAGAVLSTPSPDMRNRLAGLVISNFMKYYHGLDKNTFLNSYRSRLLWKGQRIRVINGSEDYQATLVDVNDSCALIVRTDDGRTLTVSSGEISIRKV